MCAVWIIVLRVYVPDLCFLRIYSPKSYGREETASSPPHIMYICIFGSIHIYVYYGIHTYTYEHGCGV